MGNPRYKLCPVAAPESCTQVLVRGGSLGDADFDDSCTVGVEDLNVIAGDWLDCIDPDIASCDKPWEQY